MAGESQTPITKPAIYANIPLYKQTDPRAFPAYEFREYPKALRDERGQPIVVNPTHLMTTGDDRLGVLAKEVKRCVKGCPRTKAKPCADCQPLAIGGDFVIADDPVHEAALRKEYGLPAMENAKAPAVMDGDDLAKLLIENDALEKALERRRQLKALLAEEDAAGESNGKRRGRKPAADKVEGEPATPGTQSFEEFAGTT